MLEDTRHKSFILEALRSGETLTNLEILDRFGCMNGKGRISDLRQAGWDIRGVFIKVKNRFNETVRVMEYSIPPESREKPLESKIVKKPKVIPRTPKGTFQARELTVNKGSLIPALKAYFLHGRNSVDAAAVIGISQSSFTRLCQECGIKLRDKSELPIPDTIAYLAAMDALRFGQECNTPSSLPNGEGDVFTGQPTPGGKNA